jgi:hypothetical protein
MKADGTNAHSYSYLSFDKEAQNMCWRKDSLFTKWYWENYRFICRRLKLDSSLLCCTSINSKWIKDLKARSEIAKLLQERIGNILEHIGVGNSFMNRTPITQQLRQKINKWDYIKLKSFCTAKEKVTRLK